MRYKDSFALNRTLIKLAEKIINKASKKLNNANDKNLRLKILLLSLGVKGLKTFKAINLLSKKWLGEDALSLLRVISENLIILLYLQKNSQVEILEKFVDCMIVLQLEQLKAIDVGCLSKSNYQVSEIKKLEEECKKIKEKYGNELYKNMRWGKFSGQSIKDMFDDVGKQQVYDSLYRIASISIHATDIGKHVKLQNNRILIATQSKNIDTMISLDFSRIFLCEILENIDSLFEIGCKEKIKKITEKQIAFY